MKKIWAILAGLMILPSVWATTYTYTGPNYAANTIHNYTPPCNFGSCGDYLTSMNITGTFTTAAPLAPNLANAIITTDVTSFSFTDGLTTFDSTATNQIRIVRDLKASTNAQGLVTAFTVLLRQWRVGAASHVFGDIYDELWLSGYGGDIVYYNNRCNFVGADISGGGTGVADSCNGDTTESESYASSAAGSVTWPDMPFTIGGTVSGLATGETVILKNNGADDTPVASNTTFTFTTGLVNGATYAVTVGTPPTGKTCTVSNGTGTVGSANVTNVAVACAAATASIPTLSEWGMIILSSLLALGTLVIMRRRQG